MFKSLKDLQAEIVNKGKGGAASIFIKSEKYTTDHDIETPTWSKNYSRHEKNNKREEHSDGHEVGNDDDKGHHDDDRSNYAMGGAAKERMEYPKVDHPHNKRLAELTRINFKRGSGNGRK